MELNRKSTKGLAVGAAILAAAIGLKQCNRSDVLIGPNSDKASISHNPNLKLVKTNRRGEDVFYLDRSESVPQAVSYFNDVAGDKYLSINKDNIVDGRRVPIDKIGGETYIVSQLEGAKELEDILSGDYSYKKIDQDGTPYFALIDKHSKKYGIHPSIVRGLMGAESDFNPSAGSIVGAEGVMQFMPATARAYGLVVNGNRDDRLDPEKAIPAGINLIRDNLSRLKDLEKAIQAYNSGPGKKAFRRDNGAHSYHLPEETQDYYPRIIGRAMLDFASSPVDVDDAEIKFKGNHHTNYGTNIRIGGESDINSILSGRVYSVDKAVNGKRVVVYHGYKTYSSYSGLDESSVKPNEYITEGQKIGKDSDGFELYVGVDFNDKNKKRLDDKIDLRNYTFLKRK
ncbi:MAG TPA: transglycosylase SLT domain-containing protein [Nanoarchaeota archaeon]|nr:MAG: lytic transglycosylase protein [archaeon GW2011_AR6]MBS3082809.1 transglycosylase SLT domain-containing protein [Candidatus Pacearchaeota archaeon]HIH17990.1 transglycosylase SLT domain-containing protein [Nanoarchaeota archaeon]HIH34469.1 transglycosylase SLT domain-containing protein [Nanoarchaeota archaeon]HIH50973.1 transglycosylase SLT domain-containing protein [Nanoarchaeota archaeon]